MSSNPVLPGRPAPAAGTALKALEVIELLSVAPRGCGLNEIARGIRSSRSSTLRILASLDAKGLLARDPETRRYRLTLRLLELGTRLLDQLELPDAAKPHLQELSRQTGETAHLGVLDDWHVIFIGKYEPPSPIRLHARVGYRAPSHCTGLGKVMLAGLSPAALEQYFAEYALVAMTAGTITDPHVFSDHLALVRDRGYAVDAEEHRVGIGCVAAPVRDHTGRVVAGISVSGAALRVLRQPSVVEAVTQAGEALSKALGWGARPALMTAREV